jgi:hypothetical protein
MRLTEARQGVHMLKFMDVFGRWDAATLTQLEAAELLGVGERSFRRYGEEGEAGLLDRRIGKASGRRVPVDRCEEVEHLYRTRYQGLTARHFHEHLVRDRRFAWSYSWTKRSYKAGTCCRKRSVAAHTVASGRVVRCPG